jgi:15-cis-phytoene desaturase
MEGAVLAGKLAAEVISDRAAGVETKGQKDIRPEITSSAAATTTKPPPGVKGEGAIAFGGGQVLSKAGFEQLRDQDDAQFADGPGQDGPGIREEKAAEKKAPEPVAA